MENYYTRPKKKKNKNKQKKQKEGASSHKQSACDKTNV